MGNTVTNLWLWEKADLPCRDKKSTWQKNKIKLHFYRNIWGHYIEKTTLICTKTIYSSGVEEELI